MSLIDDLKANINGTLGLRDSLGVGLKSVSIVTRTWSGAEIGSGTPTDVTVAMSPSPRIVDYSHDLRITEGGAVKQGDILLKMISKQSYPLVTDVDASTTQANVEKFYNVGGKLYRVVKVREKHVTWNVLLRPLGTTSGY